jgi:hypothetical protein
LLDLSACLVQPRRHTSSADAIPALVKNNTDENYS